MLPLVVAGLVLLAALGTGGYFLFLRDGGGDPDGPVPITPTATETDGTTSPSATTTPPETTVAALCAPAEHPADLGNDHLGEGDPVPTYSSDPPTSGPHSSAATETGTFYSDPQPATELIHAMEHGAVIFWTNGLSPEEQELYETTVREVFAEGYQSLIGVPHPDMDAAFAMTAWGTLQTCDGVDPEAIRSFVESYYASGIEGSLACFSEEAGDLPRCQEVLG